MRVASAGLLFLIVASAACNAQELRCTQLFMNASEKRICATPALMDLDQQMGALGRRAAPHQDGFGSDQRRFRKALKTCNGDEACLTRSYQIRISELQAFVDGLQPPSEEEAARLARADAKAEAKRNAQAPAREKIAGQFAEDAMAEAPLEAPPAEAVVNEPGVVPMQSTPADAPAEPASVEPAPPAATDAGETGWGGLALMGALMIGAIAWFKSWLNRAVRRCPGCKKWFAGKVIGSEREAYTDYQTKTFEDVHKDRNYVVTGRTTKQRQVKVRVVETTDYLQCLHCDCKWSLTSTSRSS